MSGKKLFIVMMLPSLFISSAAFGWAGNTHAALCQKTFDDPVVSPLLGGIAQSSIENYTGEPPGNWHDQQWTDIVSRAYIDTAGAPNGNNWNSLDETTRLQYLQHNTTDVGVPLGHSPANSVYTNTVAEAILEAQVATWSTYPSVVGTCNYTHNRNGHSYSFTGTINNVVNTFYNACRDNATWFKSTKNFFGLHSTTDNRDAAWNGTTIGLMLQRAVMTDYFLAKQLPVATADNYYGSTVTNDIIHFDMSGSYDPDNISWNSNGTYSNTWDGIQIYGWDFNNDGSWDWASANPTIDLSAWHLLYGSGLGLQANQWNTYRTCAIDWEGKWGFAYGGLYLSTGGGAPEPATMSLLAIGGLALLRRKK